MRYKDEIIREIAEIESKKIVRKIILFCQKNTQNLLSDEDSGLKNIWDEICVQMQYQESTFWEWYLIFIESYIMEEVKKLNIVIKKTIWLQTMEGIEWEDDEDEEIDHSRVSIDENDIVQYISRNVLSAACDYTNARIEKYLDLSNQSD